MKELLIMAKSLGGGGSEVALIELINALPEELYNITLVLLIGLSILRKIPRVLIEQQYRLIMECRKSRLSDNQWCLNNDINPGTFYN